ncbi:hypothetical protein KY343_00975 [Candidatus Woesearchaeota archaeon]|nr:hypothetical protein [Candidatus Woesearchaeota archaeon]
MKKESNYLRYFSIASFLYFIIFFVMLRKEGMYYFILFLSIAGLALSFMVMRKKFWALVLLIFILLVPLMFVQLGERNQAIRQLANISLLVLPFAFYGVTIKVPLRGKKKDVYPNYVGLSVIIYSIIMFMTGLFFVAVDFLPGILLAFAYSIFSFFLGFKLLKKRRWALITLVSLLGIDIIVRIYFLIMYRANILWLILPIALIILSAFGFKYIKK